VSGALLGQFVSCLEHDLLAAPEEAEGEPEGEGVPVPPAEPAPVSADDAIEPVAEAPPPEPAPGGVRTIDGPEAEAVDLLAIAGGTFAKYAIGAVVAIAVVVLVLVLLLT
jgi:hypothetical protein